MDSWYGIFAILGVIFIAPARFLSSTVVVVGRSVWCLLLNTTVVSFFSGTFQIVVLAMPNVRAMAQINFPCFSPTECSLVFFILLNNKCSLHGWNPRLKPRVESFSFFHLQTVSPNNSALATRKTCQSYSNKTRTYYVLHCLHVLI